MVFVDTFSLSGENLGWIILFNVGSFLVVDILKIQFRKAIGEEPGDVIISDELMQPKSRTEVEKTVEKGERYVTHRESCLPMADRHRVVKIKSRSDLPSMFSLGGEDFDTGYINKNPTASLARMRQLSTRM